MISSLLHLVGLRPRVYYTLTNFRGGGQGPLAPPPLNTPMYRYTHLGLAMLPRVCINTVVHVHNYNNNNNNLYFVLETWDITVHLITYIV